MLLQLFHHLFGMLLKYCHCPGAVSPIASMESASGVIAAHARVSGRVLQWPQRAQVLNRVDVIPRGNQSR